MKWVKERMGGKEGETQSIEILSSFAIKGRKIQERGVRGGFLKEKNY